MVNNISSVPLLNNDKYKFYNDINVIHPLSLKKNGKDEKELQSFFRKRNLELNILGFPEYQAYNNTS